MGTNTKQNHSIHAQKDQLADAASELYQESKKLAQELVDEGLHRVQEAQDSAKEYTDELAKKIRQNPMTSVLVAAGIGYLLSAILRK